MQAFTGALHTKMVLRLPADGMSAARYPRHVPLAALLKGYTTLPCTWKELHDGFNLQQRFAVVQHTGRPPLPVPNPNRGIGPQTP
jgi:hypothetical protein